MEYLDFSPKGLCPGEISFFKKSKVYRRKSGPFPSILWIQNIGLVLALHIFTWPEVNFDISILY